MIFTGFIFLILSLIKLTQSTDLAAVYKHGVLHLRNVDHPSASYSLQKDSSLYFNLKELSYPIGLTYDPLNKEIYVADGNDYEADVYAFTISNPDSSFRKAISKNGISRIESLAFHPTERTLYWSDSQKNGIYSSIINKDNASKSSVELIDDSVLKPRGISLDYCNRNLFWGERDERLRRMMGHNLNKGVNQRIVQAKSDIFYQAVAYDIKEEKLVWAQTVGDRASNSSCNILKYSLNSKELELFATFENCYPFSLALDENYIYWTDWAIKGIMRLSKRDPKDAYLLVETPPIRSKAGHHLGALGLVTLNEYDPEECHKVAAVNLLITPQEMEEVDQLKQSSQCSSAPTSLLVISLCFGCFFLMTTFFLILYVTFTPRIQNPELLQRNELPSTVILGDRPAQKHKKHKLFSSFLQQRFLKNPAHDDLVRIDIEDCCQMTLCDTPCYTTLKKEGKSYHKSLESCGKNAPYDNRGLLDEMNERS